jgi:hypothetical protein
MSEFVLKGIVTRVGGATVQGGGARYDYLEIAEEGERACRLCDVLVPARLQAEITQYAIGEFRCRRGEPGVSPAHEILHFRRADGAVNWPRDPVE